MECQTAVADKPGMRPLDAFLSDCPDPMAAWKEKEDRYARFWASVPGPERVPMLLEILRRYRACRVESAGTCLDRSFALNELTTHVYRLGISPSAEEACAILRTAYHTCGHGTDVKPPLELALAHFRGTPYTNELFASLRAYRESLRHSRGVVAQDVKGKIGVILWQDLRPSHEWSRCVTSAIRESMCGMPKAERSRWLALSQSFRHTVAVEPPKKWDPPRIEDFAERMKACLGSALTGAGLGLTAAGSHILKNLVWCSIGCDDPELDAKWTELLFAFPSDTMTHDKIAAAVAYLLSLRKNGRARAPLDRISARFAYPGGKIETYRRSMSRRGRAS